MPDGKIETVVKEQRLEWPDTFAWDPDGNNIYFTTSAIHKIPDWNRA
jgi:sugar lactone lactonase YvrE